MQLRNVYLVARREFMQAVMRKTFLIGIFLPMIILGIMLSMSSLMEKATQYVKDKQTKTLIIGVLSTSPTIMEIWQNELQSRKLQNGLPQFSLQSIKPFGIPIEVLEQNAETKVRNKEWDAYVHLKGDITENGTVEFFALKGFPFDMPRALYTALQDTVRRIRLESQGLDPEQIRFLIRGISWNEYELKQVASAGEDKKQRTSFENTFIPALVLVMMMFFLVYGTSEALMRGVVAEKVSRMIEILLSSLSPMEILSGKVIGFFCVGLVQFTCWVSIGFAIVSATGVTIPESFTFDYFLYYVIFLTTGYFFFSTLFAALGSIVGNESEAQIYLVVLSMTLIMPVFFGYIIMTQPNWWLVRLLSFIPIFTPAVMTMRMATLSLPLWEILLIAGNLLFFSLISIWFGSRIFRTAILLMGKRVSVREAWRWAFSADSVS